MPGLQLLMFTFFLINSIDCQLFECDNLATTIFPQKEQQCVDSIKKTLNISNNEVCVFYSIQIDQNSVYDFTAGPEHLTNSISNVIFLNSDLSTNLYDIIFLLVQRFPNLKEILLFEAPSISNKDYTVNTCTDNSLTIILFLFLFIFCISNALICLQIHLKNKIKKYSQVDKNVRVRNSFILDQN